MAAESGAKGKVLPLKRTNRKCPVCGKPCALDMRPFCSKRCADIDLGRWLGETYRVPGEPASIGEQTDEED